MSRLFVVAGYADRDRDGNDAVGYLLKRYGSEQFGFFPPSEGKIVFFKDEGHRNDFHDRFGGFKGKADPKPGVLPPDRARKVAQAIARNAGARK